MLQVVDLRSGLDRQSAHVLPTLSTVSRFEIQQCQNTSSGPCFIVSMLILLKNLIFSSLAKNVSNTFSFFLQFESLPKCEVTQSKIDAPHQHFSVTTIFSVMEKHFLL